jgi:hypothetical protein
VVCDNTSNNADMMNRFKKLNMKRLTGPVVRVHCMPHILNLASKSIAAPFIKKRSEAESDRREAEEGNDHAALISLSDDEEEADGQGDNENGSFDEDFDPNAEVRLLVTLLNMCIYILGRMRQEMTMALPPRTHLMIRMILMKTWTMSMFQTWLLGHVMRRS